MPDPIINSTPQVPMVDPTLPQTPEPKKPGMFGRIMGGVLSGALNLVAPGLGSILGGSIGAGVGGGGALNAEAMLNKQMENSMQLLTVQNRLQTQSQEFTTFTNLLKSKHDSQMSAISNFKS